MAVAVTLTLADKATDTNPGFRITAAMDNAQAAITTSGNQDTVPSGAVEWQLQCDRITHQFSTPAIPLGLPGSGQGDQLRNQMINIGMRTETIR